MAADDIGPKPWHLYKDVLDRCKDIPDPPSALRAILDDHDESGLAELADGVVELVDSWS
jgi:hypothetical protein